MRYLCTSCRRFSCHNIKCETCGNFIFHAKRRPVLTEFTEMGLWLIWKHSTVQLLRSVFYVGFQGQIFFLLQNVVIVAEILLVFSKKHFQIGVPIFVAGNNSKAIYGMSKLGLELWRRNLEMYGRKMSYWLSDPIWKIRNWKFFVTICFKIV